MVSGLALNLMPDPTRAVAEFVRVATSGAVVAGATGRWRELNEPAIVPALRKIADADPDPEMRRIAGLSLEGWKLENLDQDQGQASW